MSNQANEIFEMSDNDFISKFGSGDSVDIGNSNDTNMPNEGQDYSDSGNNQIDDYAYDDIDPEFNGEFDNSDIYEEESIDPETASEEYRRIIGSPIKGAGKEITLGSTDEAIKLIQMGMGYHKSMEQMKPHKKAIAMLERNNMLDEEKLNFAIDLMNNNPQAIKKLVADSGVELYDSNYEDGESSSYVPTNYGISDNELAVQQAIQDIESTPTYQRTLSVLGQEWDEKSRQAVTQNPNFIGMINQHIANGMYDTVSREVDRLKMIGDIPFGMTDLDAYMYAGNSLYADKGDVQQSAPNQGQQQNNQVANERQPIITPRKDTVRQKRATNVPRNTGRANSGRPTANDVWSMSDDEFVKQFGLFDNF